MSEQTGAAQFDDYLVTYEVEQWCDGEVTTDETTFRVSGVSELAAAQGGQAGLQQLSHVGDVEIVEVRRDHDE